ncbi:MAG: hypothetical protein CR993_05130 [Rhodobacterales bacterium]|nr:MAG: hypothetical protein CR993_05130 [Rhodobacterales bacterium]
MNGFGFLWHPAVGIFLAGGAALVATSLWRARTQAQELRRERAGESLDDFLAALPDADPTLARIVYQTVQNIAFPTDPIPLRPGDDLIRDLGFDLMQVLTELVPEIARRSGRKAQTELRETSVAGLVAMFEAQT